MKSVIVAGSLVAGYAIGPTLSFLCPSRDQVPDLGVKSMARHISYVDDCVAAAGPTTASRDEALRELFFGDDTPSAVAKENTMVDRSPPPALPYWSEITPNSAAKWNIDVLTVDRGDLFEYAGGFPFLSSRCTVSIETAPIVGHATMFSLTTRRVERASPLSQAKCTQYAQWMSGMVMSTKLVPVRIKGGIATPDGRRGVGVMPLRPIWWGVVGNAVAYAAITGALVWLWSAGVRANRRRRGLCVACAYPVPTIGPCPECGQARVESQVA